MTEAQQEAVKKAWNLITEHFEHALVVLDWETEPEERDGAHVAYWHGGAITAMGLARFAEDGIRQSGTRLNTPET